MKSCPSAVKNSIYEEMFWIDFLFNRKRTNVI